MRILPDVSDEDFVKRAYVVVLHREVDEPGYHFWVGKLKNVEGKDFWRKDLIHILLGSSERRIKKIFLSEEEVIEKIGAYSSVETVVENLKGETVTTISEKDVRKKIGVIISQIGHSGEDHVLCMLADFFIEHGYDVTVFYQRGNKIYDCKARFVQIERGENIPVDCFAYICSSHEASVDILNSLSVNRNRKIFYVQSYMQHIKKKQIYDYSMIKIAASEWIKKQINADYLIEPCFDNCFIKKRKYDVFCLDRGEKEGNDVGLKICEKMKKEGYSIKILKYPDEFVSPDEIKKIYAESIVFLYTFQNDCFPLMPFEALNQGCRIVALEGNPGLEIYRNIVSFTDEKNVVENIVSFVDAVRGLENHNVERMGNSFLKIWGENLVWLKNLKYINKDFNEEEYMNLPLRKKTVIENIFKQQKLSPPKITVLIPTKNRGWCIENAIKSVLNEEYPNLEIIVIDCASTDNSSEIVKKYPIIFDTGNYQNEWEALNRGIEISTGKYLSYLADDDLHEDGAFTIMALYLEKHPETFGVFGYAINLQEDGKEIKLGLVNQYKLPDFNNLIKGNYIPGNCLIYRNKKSFFNTKDIYGNDYDKWLFFSAKYGWDYIPIKGGTVISHPQTGTNIMSDKVKWDAYRLHRDIALTKYMPLRVTNKKDFHIALFSDSYGRPIMGGSVRNHWNVVRALYKAGVDITLVCNNVYGDDGVPLMNHNDFFKMNKTDMENRFNVFHVMTGFESLFKLNEIGIVPIAGSNIVTNCLYPELSLALGRDLRTNNEMRICEKKNFDKVKASFWVAQSEYQIRCYRDLMNYQGETYRFTNTIDTENFPYMEKRGKKILWVGSADPIKGMSKIDKLASMMPKYDFFALSLDSDIGFKSKNIETIVGHNINKKPEILKKCCLQVCTSITENQPLGVIEGMVTGLPCVAFDSPVPTGVRELVFDDYNGYLVPYDDFVYAEKTIRDIMGNKKHLEKLSVNAHNYSVNNFSYESCVPKFLSVYAKYLDKEIKNYVKQHPVPGDK